MNLIKKNTKDICKCSWRVVMKYYFKSLDDVLEYLKSNKDGLSKDEVLRRIKINGYNKLEEGKKDSLIKTN